MPSLDPRFAALDDPEFDVELLGGPSGSNSEDEGENSHADSGDDVESGEEHN